MSTPRADRRPHARPHRRRVDGRCWVSSSRRSASSPSAAPLHRRARAHRRAARRRGGAGRRRRSGEVRGIELAGHQVLVDFTLDSDVRLGSDTTAAVKVATLLGTALPGGDPGRHRGAWPTTRSRSRAPGAVQPPGRPRGLHQGARRAGRRHLQVVPGAGRRAPRHPRRRAGRRSRESPGLSAVAAQAPNQLGALLSAVRQVTGDLASNSGEIIDLMRQSNLVLRS